MRLDGRRMVCGALAAVMVAALVQGVGAQQKFEPRSGQAGKDVVWVPTPQETVELMLNMAKLTKDDYHIDLGSGDGRTVITAAKRGARALGIEYNPDMVALSVENAKAAGVTDRATFRQADLFKTDFSQANVLTLFLLPDINLRIRPQILDMKPGTRIVSNTFMMGSGEDEWVPDETRRVSEDCVSWCTAHLWIVPAKVNGKWTMNGQALTLNQEFQNVTGTMGSVAITDGKLDGTSITFTAGGTTYTGTVSADGKSIKGADWSATR
ncbi:MAG: class I SAM-dependent methyltransferase [Acidimicrobiia bacterium]|nr:class I SAM-dependent methyltransferase [Acidimicrobiia bacterium]